MRPVIFFDLHGTLEKNTSIATLESVNLGLEHIGLEPILTIEQVHHRFGQRYPDAFIEEAYPDFPEAKLKEIIDHIASIETEIVRKHIKPNDYAIETLEELCCIGYENHILSNALQAHLEDIFLPVLNFWEYVAKTIGVTDLTSYLGRKISGDVSERKAKVMLATAGAHAIVGDRKTDIIAGKLAGVITIHYQNEHITDEEVLEAGADYSTRCLSNIPRFLGPASF